MPPNTSPTLLRLDASHAEAVADLEGRCFSLPWTSQQYRSALQRPSFAAFGAFIDGTLAGYVSLFVSADEAEIVNVGVLPQFRGQGLARRLMSLTLDALRRTGRNRAVLDVREGNGPALGLYASLGFSEAGRRRGYYVDTGEDAIVMELRLESPPSGVGGSPPA
ncbi:MAG: ribosomal protein S18-alanine N-acetyltransferase [Desulfovibrio sp.]|jgi:ribosomal-protein-alanine N-acetyltransferase|nr:ribosomal protein S18-alanine N-acetyltransferase [Desulfovibrio sp.]